MGRKYGAIHDHFAGHSTWRHARLDAIAYHPGSLAMGRSRALGGGIAGQVAQFRVKLSILHEQMQEVRTAKLFAKKATLERRLQALERSRDISAAKPSLLQPSDVQFTCWSQPVDAILYLKGKRWSVWWQAEDIVEVLLRPRRRSCGIVGSEGSH